MSQHSMTIANAIPSLLRPDLESALKALHSSNIGATAPATTFPNMIWLDSTASALKLRNNDDDAWITLGWFDFAAGTFTARRNDWEPWETVYFDGTDGTLASVETSNFADGYEYAFAINDVGHNSGSSQVGQIELYGETSAAYSSPIAISGSMTATQSMAKSIRLVRPRDPDVVHTVISRGLFLTYDEATLGGSWSSFTSDGGAANWATAQKILKARFSFSAGSIDEGRLLGYKRRVS